MLIKLIAFIAALFLAAGRIDAATIYVSLQGDDAAAGDSWAAAKRTIQAGVDTGPATTW